MHLGVDLHMQPVTDDQYASLVSYEGRELITESLTMEELESTFFQDIPASSDSAMLEAITTTRSKLDQTMRAFIRALNGQLTGTNITAGTDTAAVIAVPVVSGDKGTEYAPVGEDAQSIGGAIIGRVRNINSIPVLPAQIPLSDGQSVSVVFLSPTATNKIASGDQLVAFQFLLNKRDITHVVAPMGGEDLSLKQVALSLSNLVEKNSRKFKNAQARKSAQATDLNNLEAESDNLETQLADISDQGEVVKSQNDGIQQQINAITTQADGVEAHVKELQQQLSDLQADQASKVNGSNQPSSMYWYGLNQKPLARSLRAKGTTPIDFKVLITPENALSDPRLKDVISGVDPDKYKYGVIGYEKPYSQENIDKFGVFDFQAKQSQSATTTPPAAEQNNSASVMASGVKASGVDKVGDKFTVDKIGMGSVDISYPRTKDEITLTAADATSNGVIVKGFNDKDYVSIASGLFDSVEKTFNGRGLIDFATQDKLFDVVSKDLPELSGDMRTWVIQQVMSAAQAKIIAAQKEAENKPVQTLSWYGLRARPLAVGAQPTGQQGYIPPESVATDPRTKDLVANIDPANYKFGAIGYAPPLSPKEINQYELVDFWQRRGDAGKRAQQLDDLKSMVIDMINMGDSADDAFKDLMKPNGQYVSSNPFYDEQEKNYRTDQLVQAMKEAGYPGAIDKAFKAFYADLVPKAKEKLDAEKDNAVDYLKNMQAAIDAVKALIKGVRLPKGWTKIFDEKGHDGWSSFDNDNIPESLGFKKPTLFVETPAIEEGDDPFDFRVMPNLDENGAPMGTFKVTYGEGSPISDEADSVTTWADAMAAIKGAIDKEQARVNGKNKPTPPAPEPQPTPEPEPTNNVVTNALAQLQDLMDNETNIDAYLAKMESLVNDINEAGALKENEPFLQRVADKLTAMMVAEGIA